MSNATQSYREVQRKANAGERIKIVKAELAFGKYRNGDEFFANKVTLGGVYVPEVSAECNSAGFISDREYVVLEPIAPTTAYLPDLFAQSIRDNASAVRSYLAEIDPDKCAEPNEEVAQPAPLTRAKVIEMARERVAELGRIGRLLFEDLPKGTPFQDRFYRIEFHVNREKRTVTALVRTGKYPSGKKPDAVGIAKCAPDDVFNADIGKAIAAERALGLTLTDAFVNAPRPTEPQIGNVVTKTWGIFEGESGRVTEYSDDGWLFVSFSGKSGRADGTIWSDARYLDIIDDTDAIYPQKVGEAA